MAKIRKIMTAGPLTIEALYPAPNPRDSQETRRRKREISTLAQQDLNLRNARQKLELQLAANIVPGDWFLTLTYSPERLPPNREAAKKDIAAFLRKLRNRRRTPMCYFYRMEHKHKACNRYHFHVIVTAGDEDEWDLDRLWGNGQIDRKRICIDKDHPYERLARYMTKEHPDKLGHHLWEHSRGIKKYEVDRIRLPDTADIVPPAGAQVLYDSSLIQNVYGSWRRLKFMTPDARAD